MRSIAVFLGVGMIVAAIFAFTGLFSGYPLFYEPAQIAPYQFANFLFWVLMLSFLAALLLGRRPRNKTPLPSEPNELKAQESTIVGGFELALLFGVVALISGVFGFGAVSSTLAGLAMIIFWIAIAIGLVAMVIGIFRQMR